MDIDPIIDGFEHTVGYDRADISRAEILQCSSPPPHRVCFQLGRRHRRGFSSVSPRFRTIQVCPKDFPAMPRQSGGAAPATFVGGLTMSERVVDEGQSWASDISGSSAVSGSIRS